MGKKETLTYGRAMRSIGEEDVADAFSAMMGHCTPTPAPPNMANLDLPKTRDFGITLRGMVEDLIEWTAELGVEKPPMISPSLLEKLAGRRSGDIWRILLDARGETESDHDFRSSRYEGRDGRQGSYDSGRPYSRRRQYGTDEGRSERKGAPWKGRGKQKPQHGFGKRTFGWQAQEARQEKYEVPPTDAGN
jgi:hypothetical protein